MSWEECPMERNERCTSWVWNFPKKTEILQTLNGRNSGREVDFIAVHFTNLLDINMGCSVGGTIGNQIRVMKLVIYVQKYNLFRGLTKYKQ